MLADTTRLRCSMLMQNEGELCVCELSHALNLSQPKISPISPCCANRACWWPDVVEPGCIAELTRRWLHGCWGMEPASATDKILIEDKCISCSSQAWPAGIDWADMGEDMLIECSLQFKTQADLQCHFDQGVKSTGICTAT